MMLRLFGVIIILHGLIHLLYYGQSIRLFELKSGLSWPVPSWAFSKLLGDRWTRILAGMLCVLPAVSLVASGIGVFIDISWWDKLIAGSATLSILLFILFWDGNMSKLNEKGGIGVLINLGILCFTHFVWTQ
jgi:hypothetical protein